jgi:hypothetical protein
MPRFPPALSLLIKPTLEFSVFRKCDVKTSYGPSQKMQCAVKARRAGGIGQGDNQKQGLVGRWLFNMIDAKHIYLGLLRGEFQPKLLLDSLEKVRSSLNPFSGL